MSESAYVTEAQFEKALARIDDLEDENQRLREENEQLRERVDDVEDTQDDHGMRLEALGAGIKSVNDDIADLEDAIAHAESIEQTLEKGDIQLEQVHHGDGIASWAVNQRAVARGHGIRTGLEDTTVLPDGHSARDNGEL